IVRWRRNASAVSTLWRGSSGGRAPADDPRPNASGAPSPDENRGSDAARHIAAAAAMVRTVLTLLRMPPAPPAGTPADAPRLASDRRSAARARPTRRHERPAHRLR